MAVLAERAQLDGYRRNHLIYLRYLPPYVIYDIQLWERVKVRLLHIFRRLSGGYKLCKVQLKRLLKSQGEIQDALITKISFNAYSKIIACSLPI